MKFVRQMQQLKIFNFHIVTSVDLDRLGELSSEDNHVRCILNKNYANATCQVFSLPFRFHFFVLHGNEFPSVTFKHVTFLRVHPKLPCEHKFFVRIAQYFPMLKLLDVYCYREGHPLINGSNVTITVVEFPPLVSLRLNVSNSDLIELLLTESKIKIEL